MRLKNIFVLLLLFYSVFASTNYAVDHRSKKQISRIAFGSCNQQNLRRQKIWADVVAEKPQLWIWLGDIIYADTTDMKKMASLYNKQKAHPDYQALLKQCEVIGTWDDHDYGGNNADSTFPEKEKSKQLLLNFLEVSKKSPRRNRDGIYSSHVFGKNDKQIKVILLDTRFNLTKKEDGEGDLLGEKQWAWLEEEIKNSDSKLHIIASSIQIIPKQHPYEKWNNLPKQRRKLLDLLRDNHEKNFLLLSGDRHIGEISKMELQIKGGKTSIWEFTSSGLTHSAGYALRNEKNNYRIGTVAARRNFGFIEIEWLNDEKKLAVDVLIRGIGGRIFCGHKIYYDL